LLPRAVVMMLMALPCAMCAPEASAFDGHRKGFTMGIHLGYAHVDHSSTYQGFQPGLSDSAGAVTDSSYYWQSTNNWTSDGGTGQLKLGYGFSELILLHCTTQLDLRGVTLVTSTQFGDYSNVVGTTTTLSMDYYPGGAGGSWYASAGIGGGSMRGLRGPAYRVSIGRDLWGAAQLEATVSRYGSADSYNVATRITFGWLWR
jgi:hypothetical protein